MKTAFADGRARRIAVLAGLNLVLAVGGWLALVAPQRHHAAAAQQQVQSVKTQLQQIAAVTTPIAPKQPVIHTAPIYVLSHAMPTTEDEPDMLLAVDQVARSSGVKVTTISPSTPQQAVGYTTLPMTLDVEGSYSEITSFLAKLRTLVAVQHGRLYASGRLFSVQQVGLTPASTGSGISATMTVDAYVFGQIAGAAPLPVGATATSTTGTSSTSTSTSTTSTSTTSG